MMVVIFGVLFLYELEDKMYVVSGLALNGIGDTMTVISGILSPLWV